MQYALTCSAAWGREESLFVAWEIAAQHCPNRILREQILWPCGVG